MPMKPPLTLGVGATSLSLGPFCLRNTIVSNQSWVNNIIIRAPEFASEFATEIRSPHWD